MASTRKKASGAKTPTSPAKTRQASARASAQSASTPPATTPRPASSRVAAAPPVAARATTARGRPARRVFINVSVRESTRKAMNTLRLRHGITQGELLDQLFTGKLRVQ